MAKEDHDDGKDEEADVGSNTQIADDFLPLVVLDFARF
jgi:hypothetical protein